MSLSEDEAFKPPLSSISRASRWQEIFGYISCVLLFGLAGFSLLAWIIGGSSIVDAIQLDTSVFFTIALIFALLGVFALFSALSSGYRNRNRELPLWLNPSSRHIHTTITVSIATVPLLLFLGLLVSKVPILAKYLLPVLGVLMILIPIIWLVDFGSWKLPGGSPQRKWGLLWVGSSFTPIFIIVVELIFIAIGLVIFLIWAADKPQITDPFMRYAMQLTAGTMDPEVFLEQIQGYLLQPSVIVIGVIAIAVVTPIIEESLKTIGVWFFARRKINPVEGYVGGLISGAGFALFEGAFNVASAVDGQTMASLAVGRLGGSLVHIFLGGLVGWGLASLWSSGKPLKFLGVFSLSIFIHGLWNFLALASFFMPLIIHPGQASTPQETFLYSIPLVVLDLLVLIGFISITLILRGQNPVKEVESFEIIE